ncbi:MAG: HEPN domain-containing protein [Spirochaetota bacterium]|nr:HEPN domain-containing protein [Spirochaetota bacterium]
MNRWNDWYEQGLRDFEKAKLDLEYNYYEWACFSFQQASEKVLKALALHNGFTVWGHSLNEIIKVLSKNISITDEVMEKAKLLDIYYIPTRYPNGFASGKPADYFTKKQALEALYAADTIIRFCEGFLNKSE